jgi:hypothetical protein
VPLADFHWQLHMQLCKCTWVALMSDERAVRGVYSPCYAMSCQRTRLTSGAHILEDVDRLR